MVGGPFGPLIAGTCDLITSPISLFGGEKGTSVSEIVEQVMHDSKDQEIYEKVMGATKFIYSEISVLKGVANHQGGKLTDKECSLLTRHFGEACAETLGHLQGQIEKNKMINNDEKKSKRTARYVYYYCMLSNFKRLVLTLQCCLLRSNGMEGTYAGVSKYLCETLPTKDKKVLGFISSLPVDGDWYMLYRELHVELNTHEREIISEYLKQIGCKPMEGRLCYITNETCSEYLYTPLQPTRRDLERYSDYWKDYRRVFTYPSVFRIPLALFRIIGEDDNCNIFSVYHSEYLCVENTENFTFWDSFKYIHQGFNKLVVTKIPGNSGYQKSQPQFVSWRIVPCNDYVKIRNTKYEENLHTKAGGRSYRKEAISCRNEKRWKIIDVSFEHDNLMAGGSLTEVMKKMGNALLDEPEKHGVYFHK